ncbi:hypothetical protein DSO57_1031173 [Entomophthora muscae]|uniref:Uncharacterized protein n=1 Tax=Entomophthora muscae TaxID=34485 RepID=A0ACC2RRS7_9FUNG|nr:hypothetical protein DSO57_1031173 [Entomophthora muscae]
MSQFNDDDFDLDKLIYESGVDHLGNPMILICLCYLPDPSVHDYKVILNSIMDKLMRFFRKQIHLPSLCWWLPLLPGVEPDLRCLPKTCSQSSEKHSIPIRDSS